MPTPAREVLAVGLALAVIGWGVGTQIETVSDIRELAPQSIREVRDLNELQDATGVSGELDVSVQAPDLTDPATLRWMADFKQRVLRDERLLRAQPELPEGRNLPGPGALGLRRRAGGGPCAAPRSGRPSRELPAYDLRAGGARRSARPACPGTRPCSASASARSRSRTSRR